MRHARSVYLAGERGTNKEGDPMNIRCTSAARIAAFLLVAAVLFMASTSANAQSPDCSRCDHFTLGVSAQMNCAITVCYTYSPEGPVFCKTIGPGRAVDINCTPYQAWINTCSGPYYFIPATSDVECSPYLKFADNCCGRLCVVPSPTLCSRLEVQPSPCLTPGCP